MKKEIIEVLKNYKCNYIRDDQQISLTLKEAFDLIGLPDDQIDDELELLATELSGQRERSAGELPEDEKFIDNICISFRHDFGLMEDEQRNRLRFDASEWIRAINNNLPFASQQKYE